MQNFKELKSTHVAENKAVLLKRKNYELRKMEISNKVNPLIDVSEIEDSQLDEEFL